MEQDQELMALFAKKPLKIKPGLERVREGLQALGTGDLGAKDPSCGHPPIVLVGGTNGKGTTAGYLFQLLASTGLRVGLFTSPHLVEFAERIQHSHEPINNHKLVLALQRLKKNLDHVAPSLYEELSFFEVNTLLAQQVFLEVGCDLWILEVGMGGRWDATNAFDPCLSIITTIGLDHQEYLGPDIKSITAEKAGIMRPGIPVIWGGPGESGLEAHCEIDRIARSVGATLITGGEDFVLKVKEDGSEILSFCGKEWALPESLEKAPDFLKLNFLKAWAAFCELSRMGHRGTLPLETPALFKKIPKPPCLWARFHEVWAAPPGYPPRALILDVAHNPHGAAALKKALPKKMPGLLSILKDKDCNGILDVLREVLQPLILFRNQSERGFTRDDLAERHRDLAFAQDFTAAWILLPLLQESLSSGKNVDCNDKILVSGSVHALGEVLESLGLSPLKVTSEESF